MVGKKGVVVLSERDRSARNLALVVYVLQGVGFFNGITFIIGLVINYVKRGDVASAFVGSHFRWQIRTFWFGLLWTVIGWATLVVFVGFVILFVNSVWVIYRIVKGLLRLNDGREV